MSDDINFKEEILKNIHSFENDLLKKINNKMLELDNDYKKFHDNLSNLSDNNKRLIESLSNKNVYLDKISSLEQFRNKLNDIIITHEIRINNNIEELSSLKTNYEKIIKENLMVPGYIGASCQFKNIREYILYYINEVSKIKSEKDIIKNSFKELKIKTDSSIRTFLNLNDSLLLRCNGYTDNRISELRNLLYEKIEFMNKKEKEIKEIINHFSQEKESIVKNKNSIVKEIKEDLLSTIEIKINEINKNQREIINKAVNEKNNYMENFINQIFENKIKNLIQEKILEIQHKLINIHLGKDNSFLIKENRNNNNNDKFPLVASLSQKGITNFKNDQPINENTKQNITFSSLIKINENTNNYKQNKTDSNFYANNINDMQNDSETKLISEKISRKNNNFEKSIVNTPIICKEKDQSDVILKNKASKILIFKYEQKKIHKKLHPSKPSKLNIKKSIKNDELMNNFVNLKTLIISKKKDRGNDVGEEKALINVIEDLKTPTILEKKILSNEKLKNNKDKSHIINTKSNFKNELNHSGGDLNNVFLNYNKNFTPQQKKSEYKTLENWKKNSNNWKSERNIKIKKDKGYTFVKLELRAANNLTNGATILANKKIMNKHITKFEYPNSFASLYNVQINTRNNNTNKK